jgi:hypothetical protein
MFTKKQTDPDNPIQLLNFNSGDKLILCSIHSDVFEHLHTKAIAKVNQSKNAKPFGNILPRFAYRFTQLARTIGQRRRALFSGESETRISW